MIILTKERVMQPEAETQYTAKDIQVLSGLEAVRRRPGMYIGSTDQRGLHHLIYEIVDNAVDEAMAGYCTRIDVTILENGAVRVKDNGRGIPVDTHPQTGKSALETVYTTLHAGAKFGGGAYKVSGGLHGVGGSVVNSLSEWLQTEVCRDGRHYCIHFKRGVSTGPIEVGDPCDERGTTVTFLPDKEIFGTIAYDFETVQGHLKNTAFLNAGLEIHFTSLLHLDEFGRPREASYFFEGGLSSFVRQLNRDRSVVQDKPFYVLKKVDGTIVETAVQYNDGYSENILCFANCIVTPDGGTHLTGFRSALTRVLNDYARKQKLLRDDQGNLSGDDVREGLAAVISVKVPDPQFEGQTKSKLGNPEVKGFVDSAVGDAMAQYLEEHPSDARRIIEKCVTSQRAREAARKARELVIRKNALDGGSLPGKLADCSDRNPEVCEVYIVEGESAGGSAKMGRDRTFQAILPLKGKILNVMKAAPDKILAHEEVRAIITALGAGEGEEFKPEKLRYHKVIIMTDADVDGSHIRTLLLTFFFRRMQPLIARGYLYIAQPPLYRVQAGKEITYAYSEGEREGLLKAMEGKRNVGVQRYKGLGEMNPEQLWETTMNPANRTLLSVTMEDAMAAEHEFENLMGNEVGPRKNWIMNNARFVRNLDV